MEPEDAENELRSEYDRGGNYVIKVIRTWLSNREESIDLEDYVEYDEPDADES